MSTITYIVKVVSAQFTIDDAVAPKLTFRDGDTYVFDQADSSNAGHTLQFSITSNNSGSSEYTTGVTKTGTAGSASSDTTIITSSSTTDTLYYYSSGGGTYGEEFSNSGFTTTSEGILKPIVGAEATAEKWGPMVNHAIDQIVDKTVPKTGGTFSGAVTASAGVIGNLTGNASGTAATVTTAAQPAITSVGTLTGFTSTGIDDNATSTSVTIDASNIADFTNMPEAGGVSMIATGSNANGNYTKFSDGTLICTLVSYTVVTTSAFTNTLGTAMGTSYRTGVAKTFPHVFIAAPSVSASGEGRISVTENASASTTGVTFYTYTALSTGSVEINATAIGRWK